MTQLFSVDKVVSYKVCDHKFNNTLARTRNIKTTSMSTMHFLIEIMSILKTINHIFKGPYNKQNLKPRALFIHFI